LADEDKLIDVSKTMQNSADGRLSESQAPNGVLPIPRDCIASQDRMPVLVVSPISFLSPRNRVFVVAAKDALQQLLFRETKSRSKRRKMRMQKLAGSIPADVPKSAQNDYTAS